MIRALVFDFDGLILDTESALIRAYADVHAAHGAPFDEGEFLRSVGHADYTFDPWHAFEKHADRVALETVEYVRKHWPWWDKHGGGGRHIVIHTGQWSIACRLEGARVPQG